MQSIMRESQEIQVQCDADTSLTLSGIDNELLDDGACLYCSLHSTSAIIRTENGDMLTGYTRGQFLCPSMKDLSKKNLTVKI